MPLARQKRDHHLHPMLYDLMVELANLSSMSSSLAFSQSSGVSRSVMIMFSGFAFSLTASGPSRFCGWCCTGSTLLPPRFFFLELVPALRSSASCGIFAVMAQSSHPPLWSGWPRVLTKSPSCPRASS